MLRVYYVANDCTLEVVNEFQKIGLKSSKISTDGVLIEYSDKSKLDDYLKIAKNQYTASKDLGDVNIEQLEELLGELPNTRKYYNW